MKQGLRSGPRAGHLVTATFAAILGLGTSALAQEYSQAPMLDDLVASGELPPVEERLPANPLVVEPVESVGQYGGTWRSGLRGGGDNAWIGRTIAYDGLVRYDRNWDQIIPNIAESWEVSDDARSYTFELREGLKWNNGEPFTTEDIAFAIELMQDEAYPGSAGFIDNPQNPVSIEIEDENTFTLVFEQPNGTVLDELASVNGITIVSLNKNYCGQFYPKYNPDAEALATEMGFEGWALLMENKCAWAIEQERWANPDLPMMNAWMLTEPLTGDATRVVFERNPYYFKVDPEGNQYPYIDRLEMRVSESLEELTLMALNGEIDFQDRHIATTINRPLFFDGQEQGDYRLGSNVLSNSNTLLIQLNFNHVDEAKRELFQNKDFRIGLSHAIDRQEIIDVVFTGQGEPFQVAPRPESPFYDEELAKQYTEYDPELAAEYLEKAGLVRNGEFYTMPDGSPLTITIDTIAAFRAEWVDMLELIQLQLAAAGINVEINTIDRTLFYDKRPLGEYDAQVWQGDGGLDVIQEPRYYFPANGESVWAFRWQAWYNGTTPEVAEEPVDWAKEQMDLYTQLRQEGDPEARAALMKQILAITKEQFPVIGVSMPGPGYYIAKNNLRNVADNMLHGWLFPTPAPYDPFQWYFEQ
ncbi:ABC transporter substrate-binding protein [Devosia nitrariae]|uniref:ABC transporter substrate-binding protein n=2 Tax=Devosia nitrariae TaxID=2071872 RepID=A0ABQ5W4Q1_9HYPH|nr:ABC transporter substrate-binding protein [Devosia nitrariae]GLQ54844.1 ABC transporter substrate-binding protein [Devosia nitrariae]